MALLRDVARMHACDGNKMHVSTTSSSIYQTNHCQGHANADPLNITEMKHQLDEISSALMPPKYKPMHELILNQINARLYQVNIINTVKGGAYDDVCKLYKELGILPQRRRSMKSKLVTRWASHENSPIARHPSEIRLWKARSDTLEFDWAFYMAIKDWSELAEDWAWEVSKDLDALNAMVYPLQEKLSTQKKRIEQLHKKLRNAKCPMDMLVYDLEACSIELEDDERKVTEKDGLDIQPLAVQYLQSIFDGPNLSDEDELGQFALEARKLYNMALDIERRVYLWKNARNYVLFIGL